MAIPKEGIRFYLRADSPFLWAEDEREDRDIASFAKIYNRSAKENQLNDVVYRKPMYGDRAWHGSSEVIDAIAVGLTALGHRENTGKK